MSRGNRLRYPGMIYLIPGAHGIDELTIDEFEDKLKNNLYKLWNRRPSGSYFPPPVRAIEIPRKDGKMRQFGIPTVADRIAQAVVLLNRFFYMPRNYLG